MGDVRSGASRVLPWAGLDGVVRGSWQSADADAAGVEWRLPDANLTLLIALDGASFSWSEDGSGHWHDTTGPALAGPRLRSVLIDRGSQRALLAVDLTPGAASRLFGVPAAALVDPLVSLEEVWGGAARELAHRVAGATADEAAHIVGAALRQRACAEVGTVDRGLHSALASLRAGSPVGEVVATTGWSSGTFTRLVQREVGVRPKQLQRLARLGRLLRHLTEATDSARRSGEVSQPTLVLADVAHMSGYADHAHMTRELVAFTGMTPTQYLARGGSGYHVPLRAPGVTISFKRSTADGPTMQS